MLSYFPSVYPNELLYSVIARLHAHLGAPPWLSLLEELFGRRLIVADPDLPGALNRLAEQIPAGRGLTAACLVDELTQFPYYAAFQSPRTWGWAHRRLCQGTVADVHIRLGLLAFRSRCVKRLRFCPRCLEDMAAAHGEYYWRRDQQLPGVFVCPIHAVPLHDSLVDLPYGSRHGYLWASDATCPSNAPELIPTAAALRGEPLWHLAIASAALLGEHTVRRSPGAWTAFYRELMQQHGMAHSPRYMDQEALDRAMRAYYGTVLPWLPGVIEGDRFRGDWLAGMVRKQRKTIHPLYHLLLQICLSHQAAGVQPFGAGPWPCHSPLHGKERRAAVTRCDIHRNHDHQVGVFTCSCGYTYTRTYVEATGDPGPPRFQSYGPLLKPALERLVGAGASLRQTARQLGLDPKTVVRLAGELGVVVPWKPSRPPARVTPAARARKARPRARSGMQATGTKSVARSARWSLRDEELRSRIAVAVQRIRGRTPPMRVSMAQIERELGQPGWVTKRRRKLPGAAAALEAAAESTRAFQMRRAAWVIRERRRCAQGLQPWRVMRQSGLTAKHLPAIGRLLAAGCPHRRSLP
jgi:hypothetical protein